MKRKLTLSLLAFMILSLTSCNTTNNSSIEFKPDNNEISLKFYQLSYISEASNKNDENIGYYFENEMLAETIITYEKGHYLSENEIDKFYDNTLNYNVPTLNGDGYWSYTFFTTKYDEKTKLSTDYLYPQYLNNNINIYFAIYG